MQLLIILKYGKSPMQKKILSLIILLTLVILTGCDTPTPQTTPEVVLTEEPATFVIPTPSSADVGTVAGVIKEQDTPAANIILYLGEILKNTAGTPATARFNRVTSIHTGTDDQGRFVFADVPAGTYVLIYDRVSDALMLKHPDTGKDYFVTVTAGQVNDLGEMIFDDLPLP